VAALLGLPYLSYAARIEPSPDAGTVRVHRIAPSGFDVLEAPMPAMVVCTQALGEPRYPSLKGIMAARSRELSTRGLADIGLSASEAGGSVATTAVVASAPPPERPPTRVVRGPAAEAAREVADFLAQRRIV
jgi:electron transfer flavoprotein beta subunit